MVELVIPRFLLDETYPMVNLEACFRPEQANLSGESPDAEEKILLADLFSALMGGTGSHIRKSPDGTYSISCICRDSARGFVEKLLPSCARRVIVQQFISSHMEFHYGRIVHALCAAFRHFLRDYDQQIADMSASVNATLPLIVLEMQQLSDMLEVACSIISHIPSLRGAQIISFIHDRVLLSFRGLIHLKTLVTFFFNESLVPLLRMIEKWIYVGEVDDPHGEFFIRVNPKIAPEDTITDNLWDDRFSVRSEFVPRFIPPTVIDVIFSAGKAQSVLFSFSNQKGKFERPITLDDLLFEGHISNVFKKASHCLIAVLKHDHDLNVLFEAVRKVFLCERGDWLNWFMRSADFIMRRARDQIHPQDFDPHIAAVVNEPLVKFIGVAIEDEQLAYSVQSIHAITALSGPGISMRPLVKAKITTSKTFWEFFSFVPVVNEPLNLILTQAAQKKYQLLFRHFLLWRRLEQKFCHNWRLKKSLRPISAQRHSMHVFITAYLNYMTATVVRPAWAVFEAKVEQVQNIEHLIHAHERLLQDLLKGCFLLNEKLFQRVCYLAMMCWHFAKDMKKWAISVNNLVTGEQGKRELARPVVKGYPRFLDGVNKLIKELRVQAEIDADQSYSAFALCLTVNLFFEKEA
jgi:hypothetical protein